MFTICRGRRFRCLVSSVVSLYLFLNTFVYASEIFPRVFCHGGAPVLQTPAHAHDATCPPLAGAVFQPGAHADQGSFCAECKSAFGHHLMALFSPPVDSQSDQAAPESGSFRFAISEYRDRPVPPPPR